MAELKKMSSLKYISQRQIPGNSEAYLLHSIPLAAIQKTKNATPPSAARNVQKY